MRHFIIILVVVSFLIGCRGTYQFTAKRWRASEDFTSIGVTADISEPFSPPEIEDSTAHRRGYIEFKFGDHFDIKKIKRSELCFSKLTVDDDSNINRTKSICIDLNDPHNRNEWTYNFIDIENKFNQIEIKIDDKSIFAIVPYISYDNKIKFFANPNFARLDFDKKIIKIIEEESITKKDTVSSAIIMPETEITLKVPNDSLAQQYLECMLSDKFIKEINFSKDSKLYKITEIYEKPVNPTINYGSAKFVIPEEFKSFTNKVYSVSETEKFKHWLQQDSVAFLFEGYASPAKIKKGSNIRAKIDSTHYYKWDKDSDCLVEKIAHYDNRLINNEDLPILRACKTSKYFADILKMNIKDIDERLFPVARKIKPDGVDDPKERIVTIYIIAKPQEAILKY